MRGNAKARWNRGNTCNIRSEKILMKNYYYITI